MAPPRVLVLPDGRRLAVDDVGDPEGLPVIYLHGTPDSRLARHPDDGVAAACGARLLAVDRPGAGDSDLQPEASLRSLGNDLAHALDILGIERAALLGWSSGGLFALAAATVLGDRVLALSLVGTVPPVEAYAERDLVAALGPARRPFVELAAELSPRELALELAPYLVPWPLTPALALDHVLEAAGEWGRVELAQVRGAAEQLARALAASVQAGVDGLVHDIELQLEPGLELSGLRAPLRSIHGADDGMSPPSVGDWLARRVPHATVDVIPGAGHHLLFSRWASILEHLVEDAQFHRSVPAGC
ncbi:MAG: alpha/beta hydrolase [Acidimicrobiales bacterium]